jgi:diguanylate cyclase (GGDEF)-like protein
MIEQAAATDIMRGELLALRAALDEVPFGVVLLDSELRAQFINRAFRKMWRLSDAKADSKPAFVSLMHHGGDTCAYDIPQDQLKAYVAERVAQVKAGDPSPRDIRLARGEVLRFQCTALPNGGRMLSYADVTDLVRDAAEKQHLATTDAMTDLYNRRHFLTLAEAEWQRFQRYCRPLSLLIFDIDRFKAINDKLGHDAGDRAIAEVAALAGIDKRPSDILARLGGDEFALLLPETGIQQAGVVAERLREKVARSPRDEGRAEMKISVSVGAAGATSSMPGIQALIKAADEALYRAKFLGRNRVSVAMPAPTDAHRLAAE